MEIGAGVYRRTTSSKVRELFVFAGKGMSSRFLIARNQAGVISSTNREVDYSRFAIQADFGNKAKKLNTL
jgi:hypothetical protein